MDCFTCTAHVVFEKRGRFYRTGESQFLTGRTYLIVARYRLYENNFSNHDSVYRLYLSISYLIVYPCRSFTRPSKHRVRNTSSTEENLLGFRGHSS